MSDVISSTEDGWWKFLGSSSLVNKKQIEFDKKLLKTFYLNSGYYDVQISSSDVNFIGTNQADVIFSINSGNKYYFSKFVILDNDKNLNLKNIKELNKLVSKNLKVPFLKKIRRYK